MNISLSRMALLQAVQRCQSIVEKRHTVPILANILLKAEDQTLNITATDLEVGIRSRTSAKISQTGAITVSAKKLFDIVKELDAEQDVELEATGSFVSIRSGRSRFRLSSLPAADYPNLVENDAPSPVVISGQQLARMIAATGFAMSHDETRKYLTGTLFEVDDKNVLRLITTDGHRLALSEFQLSGGTAVSQCIVPRKAVMEIRRLCEEVNGDVELFLGERQIRLVAGDNVLTSKLIDARFPVYQDVIPVGNPHTVLVDRVAFDQVLRRSMIVANEFTHDLRLHFSSNSIEVSAHNTEQEESQEKVEAGYSGRDLVIGFNGRYLRDALGAINEQTVQISLKDELSPVLLNVEGNEQNRYVIMPMRI
ncbi:MAG TPA: DNA polymerase III subunit beta [Mariprofundaceae bacterium]|nr:DNA polymerase III subunit beta [Mariprofundaceae bacterium]